MMAAVMDTTLMWDTLVGNDGHSSLKSC